MTLHIRNVSKTYSSGVQALKDVTLTIPSGLHRQVGTVIDEEPHGVLVPLDGRLMKDACRLVRGPVGVDVGATLEEERRDLEG